MAKPTPAPTLCEGVNVLFPRPEEIEEIQAHVFAGFADAQEDKVVADTFFRSDSLDDLPERGQGFDGVLKALLLFHGTPSKIRKVKSLSRFFSNRSLTFIAISLCRCT